MTSIDHMTANQITAEIAVLRRLDRSGELTMAGADRLRQLEDGMRRHRAAMTRGRWM